MEQDHACHFLVVEDDPNERFLFERAFSKTSSRNSLHFCDTTQDAVACLTGKGAYADRDRHRMPSAILCDMNLGTESGIVFLEWVRAQTEFRETPVIMMSGSRIPHWIKTAYGAGANSVMTKPVDLQKLIGNIDVLARYWCDVTELPPRD